MDNDYNYDYEKDILKHRQLCDVFLSNLDYHNFKP